MSGVCGIVKFDGGSIPVKEIAAMSSLLERRGPEGTSHWLGRQAAVGHSLLATTPEALIEQLPLTDATTGCVITADARLDNREELLLSLRLAREARVIGDGELILSAYLKWGEQCPKHLLGDFAFAIWDPRAQRLFCARDHMGMRPLLFHHQPGKLFVFASEANAVLAHAGVPKRINEGRIADFLDDLEGMDSTSTFFEEVFRLPPAHVLTVSSEGMSLLRYWELTAPPQINLPSDKAYAEAFLKVFTEAVRSRLRSAGPVGSMLSGGMDSGSITAVSAKLLAAEGRGPLQTFSGVGPDPATCIETRMIQSSTALPNIAPHFISHAELGDLQLALMDLPASGEPFDYQMTLIRAVYLKAHRQGIKVMLDGVAGDVALTSGNRVSQLIGQARILDAFREARGERRFWGPEWPTWKAFAHGVWGALAPRRLKDLKDEIRASVSDRRLGEAGLISTEFAKDINLPARRRHYRSHGSNAQTSNVEERRRSILHQHLFAARERYDRTASAYAVEPRDPFMDVRVLEFCLSLPNEQLQSRGWPKLVLRRAMRGLLPDSVRWRVGKEHLGWPFTLTLFSLWEGWSNDLESGKPLMERFIRVDMLGARNKGNGKALDRQQRFRLFYLLSWLRQSPPNRPATVSALGKSYAKEKERSVFTN